MTEFEKFCATTDGMSISEVQGVIDGYVSVLNAHVTVAEDLRGKLRVLRDIHSKKMLAGVPAGACCANETRSMNGGCTNCGDPCI